MISIICDDVVVFVPTQFSRFLKNTYFTKLKCFLSGEKYDTRYKVVRGVREDFNLERNKQMRQRQLSCLELSIVEKNRRIPEFQNETFPLLN